MISGYEANSESYRCCRCGKNVVIAPRKYHFNRNQSLLFENRALCDFELKQYEKVARSFEYDFSPKICVCKNCYDKFSDDEFKASNQAALNSLKASLADFQNESVALRKKFDEITVEVLSGIDDFGKLLRQTQISPIATVKTEPTPLFADDLSKTMSKRQKMLKQYFHQYNNFYIKKLHSVVFYSDKFQKIVHDFKFRVNMSIAEFKSGGIRSILAPMTIRDNKTEHLFYIEYTLIDDADLFFDFKFWIDNALVFERLKGIHNII